jgi:DHA2 family multidrug resistance protein
VHNQAVILGSDDVFYVSVVIFVLIIPLIWIARPMKDGGAAVAAAGGH